MPDEPPYIVDIAGLDGEGEPDEPAEGPSSPPSGRNWIGVQFDCCGVYMRIYRNKEGTAYQGHCPRCQRPVRVAIGPGGTTQRVFRAS